MLKFRKGRFHIQRQKETTGRVVFWNMGITCSYTLEASYGGTNMGSRAFTHFNTDDYEGIGRYFCETLQDFYDPCPVNEQLRAKILGRLTKEGSTANEPANIALSDYSRYVDILGPLRQTEHSPGSGPQLVLRWRR